MTGRKIGIYTGDREVEIYWKIYYLEPKLKPKSCSGFISRVQPQNPFKYKISGPEHGWTARRIGSTVEIKDILRKLPKKKQLQTHPLGNHLSSNLEGNLVKLTWKRKRHLFTYISSWVVYFLTLGCNFPLCENDSHHWWVRFFSTLDKLMFSLACIILFFNTLNSQINLLCFPIYVLLNFSF